MSSKKLMAVNGKLASKETALSQGDVIDLYPLHGGRVWAEGRVNEGATFYFSLPKGKGL